MPPEKRRPGSNQRSGHRVSAATSFQVATMKRRADFLATARGRKAHTDGFVLQWRDRADNSHEVRIGFTCSRKVGNAVARNRAKRRLREAARLVLSGLAQPGFDYVLIGRAKKTKSMPFEKLLDDLAAALAKSAP